jgi:hypothetical protein
MNFLSMNLPGYYYQVARNSGIFVLLRLRSLEFQLCIHTFVGEEQNCCMTYSWALENLVRLVFEVCASMDSRSHVQVTRISQ